jgi:nucleotide-binding universal stress UspA family protein
VVAKGPILLCYDGSEPSRHAIAVAAGLLVERGAVVLNVGPLEVVAEAYAAEGSGAADTAIAASAQAEAVAEAGAAEARQVGFSAETRSEVDTPVWRAIVRVADELDASVIVLGSEGLSGLRELLEGSVSHAAAAHAGRPVLVVTRPSG